MIVSHKYRFIFLKTAKTAGTSIEIALSRFLGPDDIITPISAADEALRRSAGGRGPQNYRIPIQQLRLRDLVAGIYDRRRLRFYNHMPGCEVRERLRQDVWENYFRFCVERNPFDRVISLYYWTFRSEPRPTLDEFVQTGDLQILTRRGREMYTDSSGNVLVDQVCRYEDLGSELEAFRLRIGLPESLSLPRAKASHRADQRHYREILSDQSRRVIETRFAREMSMFDYTF